jgi:hypothetical protein
MIEPPFETDPLKMIVEEMVLKTRNYQLPCFQNMIICDLVHDVLLSYCKLLGEFTAH